MRFLVCLMLAAALFAAPASAWAADEKKAPLAEDVVYVDMRTITIPIITETGLFQQFSFEVSLEVESGAKEDVSRLTPRLADAYIQDLYGALGEGHMFAKNHLVDISAIKERLSVVTKRILEPEELEASDVLIQLMHQKPM